MLILIYSCFLNKILLITSITCLFEELWLPCALDVWYPLVFISRSQKRVLPQKHFLALNHFEYVTPWVRPGLSNLRRTIGLRPMVSWSQLAQAHQSWWFIASPTFIFSDILWVIWTQPYDNTVYITEIIKHYKSCFYPRKNVYNLLNIYQHITNYHPLDLTALLWGVIKKGNHFLHVWLSIYKDLYFTIIIFA